VPGVKFTGWRVGFKKVAFTKLLQEKAGLDISKAKERTDQRLKTSFL
jgi:hypothetical protein